MRKVILIKLFSQIHNNYLFFQLARSPVFTHLNATLNGLTTIRAFGAQEILKHEFDKFQDLHSSSWFIFLVTTYTFGFALDIFTFIFTTIVIFSFLLSSDRKYLTNSSLHLF